MNILHNIKYDFMGHRKMAMILSLTLILIAFGSLFTRGLNLGLDFTGGTVVVVRSLDGVATSRELKTKTPAEFESIGLRLVWT